MAASGRVWSHYRESKVAFDPVEIYIQNPSGAGWSKSDGWTSMRLTRSKDDLTGSLDVTYFFGYVPEQPVLVDAARGREILVYIDGWLAFSGLIDARRGQGANTDMGGDEGRTVSIGPNEYTVSLTARGKTKNLIDSSHDLRANMNGTNTQEVLQRLVAPWGIELDWQAQAQALDKARFRDGSKVIDEISRVALENSHFIYETRTGDLRVTDGAMRESGDNLILGRNILAFNAQQSEVKAVTKIRVKGQRTEVSTWGEAAVLPTVVDVSSNEPLGAERTITVQHYGNATPEALQRRAMYEANKRSQASKQVTVDVFSVDSFSGVPWDLGLLHRVVIPCEGIDTVMECTGLAFTCDSSGELKTSLTLAPMPEGVQSIGFGPLANLDAEDLDSLASGATIRFLGNYPAPWTGGSWSATDVPILRNVIQALGELTNRIFGPLGNLEGEDGKPPERLR